MLSVTNMQNYLETVADTVLHYSAWQVVGVHTNTVEKTASVDASYSEETADFLKSAFGQMRFQELCQRAFGHIPEYFHKNQLEKIFVYAADLRYQDLQAIFAEIKGDTPRIRFLTEDETLALRDKCRAAESLDMLDTAVLKECLHMLAPFKKIEHVFMHHVPYMYACDDSGKGYTGMRERVAITEHLRRDEMGKLLWRQTIAKELSKYEMPEGTIISDRKKLPLYLFKVIRGGGAYKHCFKPITEGRRIIVYRGTRTLPSATDAHLTILDDVSPRIGERGVLKTFEETKNLLTKPELGFVSTTEDKVVAIGMSLGGAHAQRDAILHNIDELIAVASPGIDKASCLEFANIGGNTLRKVHHIIEADDAVDQFGTAKLGLGLKPEKTEVRVDILYPDTNIKKLEDIRPLRTMDSNVFEGAHQLIGSLWDPHVRMTSSLPQYGVVSLSNKVHPEEIKQILSHDAPYYDPNWEHRRQSVATQVGKIEDFLQTTHQAVASVKQEVNRHIENIVHDPRVQEVKEEVKKSVESIANKGKQQVDKLFNIV